MSASDGLVSVDEQLAMILAAVRPLDALDLQLADAHGCLLAEDVVTPLAQPPFDNSSMDGYAVRRADLDGAGPDQPVTLTVVADLAAGTATRVQVRPGCCARIMTGAAVPPGADAVVPVEWTDGGTAAVGIQRAPAPGAYIRRAGEDRQAGAAVLSHGTHLGAAQLGLLASVGRQRVRATPRPRVVVISTGSELVESGPLGFGQIYDSNSHALAAACREAGAQAYRVGVVPDEPRRLTDTLDDHLIHADAIVTSGGVSVGAYDVVKEVLSRLGTISFQRVAMQPGMPQGFGTIGPDATPLFALPGNPVSALVSFEVFVRPALRRMLGAAAWQRPVVPATLQSDWSAPAGKRQYVRVQLSHDSDRGYLAAPVGGAGSHLLSSFAAANALVVVPEDVTDVPAGTVLDALLLDRRGA